MKVLIELPSWLGDSAMATPAIENLVHYYNNVEVTLIGSATSIQLLRHHPKVIEVFILEKNFSNFYKTIKHLGDFNLFVSFRGSWRSKIMKFWISSKKKYQFNKNKYIDGHQVEKYNQFINTILNISTRPAKLTLYSEAKAITKNSNIKILGINPGASYGSAKRWYPEKFAEVAKEFSSNYDIVILGGSGEKVIASDIEKKLINEGVTNFQNLANKTTIDELVNQINNLDLLITGDSGPMHLAAAFQIPTIAIFGPTKDNETSQWLNEKSLIVKKHLECQPCMRRSCPLGHHNCMKLVESSEVIEAVKALELN
jgi:heptosyltransferase-2